MYMYINTHIYTYNEVVLEMSNRLVYTHKQAGNI